MSKKEEQEGKEESGAEQQSVAQPNFVIFLASRSRMHNFGCEPFLAWEGFMHCPLPVLCITEETANLDEIEAAVGSIPKARPACFYPGRGWFVEKEVQDLQMEWLRNIFARRLQNPCFVETASDKRDVTRYLGLIQAGIKQVSDKTLTFWDLTDSMVRTVATKEVVSVNPA